jgi:acyl-coenzyme A thioesterase PaaI-like protein
MSPLVKATWKLRLFGLLKIPLLSYAWPTVVDMTAQRVVVKLPLNRRTKNHLNCMYFGALAIGADCAAGLIAMERIDAGGKKISLIFQDLHADFLKRAEGDVFFTCTQGDEISALVDRTLASGERESMPVRVTATVPSKLGDEPVADFTLTLSLKRRD